MQRPQTVRKERLIHSLLICLAAVCYGLITVGARYFANRGFSLFEISFLIAFVPIPILPFLILRPELRPAKKQLGFFAVFGLIGGGLQITQFSGIVLGLPVAVVALLLYTQPLWTILLGRLILGEAITKQKSLALGLALAGVLLLLWPGGSAASGRFALLGILGGISAGLFLSLWVIWGRLSSLRRQHVMTSVFGYAISSTIVLLLSHIGISGGGWKGEWLRLDPTAYWENLGAVSGFTLLAGLLPACLAFAGLQKVEASKAGILMLLEPLSAALAAWILFSEPLTSNILWGGGLILLANYVQIGRLKGRPSATLRK